MSTTPNDPWGQPDDGSGAPPPPPPQPPQGWQQPPGPTPPPPPGGWQPPPPPGGWQPPPPPGGWQQPPQQPGGYGQWQQGAWQPPAGAWQSGYGQPGQGYAAPPVLAGWWYRVGATILDVLVLLIPDIIIGVAVSTTLARDLLGAVLQAAYVTWFLGAQSRTLGMRAVGTYVVDGQTGGPITYGRAFLRWVVTILLAITVIGGILDIFWPLWDRQNQTLHDKAVGTLVLRSR